jgi:RHS repeat-associated protein
MATAGGIGGILAVTTSSPSTPDPRHSSLFLYDGNGNVVTLASADSAATLATYEYGPFGNTLVASGPLADANPIRFSTKYFEGAVPPGSPLQPSAFIPQPSLYYYGYRYYSPGLGRWVSRDPIGESGGSGLYSATGNHPTDGGDLLGLRWQRVGSTSLYDADSDSDTLQGLAMQLGRPWGDYVCIWPVGPYDRWTHWPEARKCARANAHNLLAKSGATLSMIARNEGGKDIYLRAAYSIVKPDHEWMSGTDAAGKIKSVSREGLTPIRTLYLTGHHRGGQKFLYGYAPSGPPHSTEFEANHLRTVASVPYDWNQTLAFARQGIGPPKCWFTTNAHVWGIGCSSANGWMADWAMNIMRKGATVHGTRHLIWPTPRPYFHNLAWGDNYRVLNEPTHDLGRLLQWRTWTTAPGFW